MMHPAILFVGVAGLLFFFAKKAQAQDVEEGTEVNMNSPGFQKYGSVWTQYDSFIKNVASKYGVDWRWIKAILIIESDLGTNPLVQSGAVSSDGKSFGIAQFRIETARDFKPDATIQDLNDNYVSIDLCGQFLASLSEQFDGDQRKVAMSYNQGAGNTRAGKQDNAYYAKFVNALSLVDGG